MNLAPTQPITALHNNGSAIDQGDLDRRGGPTTPVTYGEISTTKVIPPQCKRHSSLGKSKQKIALEHHLLENKNKIS